MRTVCGSLLFTLALATPALASADYAKRLAAIDPAVEKALIGKWTNEGDHLIIEIASVDLKSGAIAGHVRPTTGPAAADDHDLIGWISAAPVRPDVDNVTPLTFSTTLYEYGTLPAWAGYLKDGKIVTLHYLVWPNKTYRWDHISTYSETWTKLPGAPRLPQRREATA